MDSLYKSSKIKIFFELAVNQKNVWHEQSLNLDSPLFNIGISCAFDHFIDSSKLNQAINFLIQENQNLRLNIKNIPPFQQFLIDSREYHLIVHDFSNAHFEENHCNLWIKNKFESAFDFTEGEWLWDIGLLKQGDNKFLLYAKFHHAIIDGWSTPILIRRLGEIYTAILNNQIIKPRLSDNYFEFISQEQSYLKSKSFEKDKVYWLKQIPELPPVMVPNRYPLTSISGNPKSNIYRLTLSRQFYQSIEGFAAQQQHTVFHCFLSTFAIYFSRVYQRNKITIGVPTLNRNGAKYKKTLGMFTNVSPVSIDVNPLNTGVELSLKFNRKLREIYRHQRFPLSELNSELKLFQQGRNSIFDIILSFEKFDYETEYGSGIPKVQQQFCGVSRYPLAVSICEFSKNNDVEIVFEGAENSFSNQDLKLLGERLLFIMQQVMNKADLPIKHINLISETERHFIYNQFNSNSGPAPKQKNVLQLFKEQVQKNPERIAIEFENNPVSYRELDLLSNKITAYLIKQNIQANDIVALSFPKGIDIITAMIAVMKSSAAYLPIPSDSPDERICGILEQAKAKIVLTQTPFEIRLSGLHPNVLCLDQLLEECSDIDTTLFEPIESMNLAYVIFTSGSTGKPKGVMIQHQAMTTRIHWLQSLFQVSEKDNVGQTIQPHFDPSIVEIFLALTQGAKLVIPNESQMTLNNFGAFFIHHKITVAALVPSSLRMLVHGIHPDQSSYLRLVCCGGERLERNLAEQFIKLTSAQLLNVYGPTEATIIASSWNCPPSTDYPLLPIGKPADHTPVFILDKNGRLMPVNETGEIVIAGETLASGYINQKEQTDKAFLHSSLLNRRIYKTGDAGYIGHDGLLYFSERLDRQVKISGYRIEMSEIESLLLTHACVLESAVTAITINQQKFLFAYVKTKLKIHTELLDELNLLLRNHLPGYMQPRKIIPVSTIKKNVTGKIDYDALPIVNLDNDNGDKEYLPNNILETQLIQIWKKILGSEKVSINGSFFEMGGNSLTAISLISEIEKLTGRRQPLSFLLKNPTIKAQAQILALDYKRYNHNLVVTLTRNNDAKHLFIAASGHGDYIRFTKLAEQLGSQFNVYMLEPKENLNSLTELARLYADSILNLNIKEFYLSGFSIGGITALETARILEQRSKPPKALILLDTYYPRWPLQSPYLFKILKKTINLFKLRKTVVNKRRLDVMLNDPGILVQLSALPKHKIQAVNLPVHLVLTRQMWMFDPLVFSSWVRMFKTNLTRHRINGFHGGMFQKPYLNELSNNLKQIITTD